MSDETTSRSSEPDAAAAEDEAKSESAAGEAPPEERSPERVDEDGLPLDRAATIDDVRSTEARHGRIAFGCTLTVVLMLVIFWLIRGGLIG